MDRPTNQKPTTTDEKILTSNKRNKNTYYGTAGAVKSKNEHSHELASKKYQCHPKQIQDYQIYSKQ